MSVSIEILAEDWMMTSGLIGLARLYENEEMFEEFIDDNGEKIELDPVVTLLGIKLTEEHIGQFAKRYIYWMIQKYSVVDHDVKKMNWQRRQVEDILKLSEDDLERTNKISATVSLAAKQLQEVLSHQFKKVEKYFNGTPECVELAILISKLDEVIDGRNEAWKKASFINEAINKYAKIMSTPIINEKLTLNVVKTLILNKVFFGQTSFLQLTFSSKSTQQHIDQLHDDFVVPALIEFKIYKELRKQVNESHLKKVLEQITADYKSNKNWSKWIYKDWIKHITNMQDEESIRTYFQKEVLHCTLIEGLVATQSYEEKIFSPLAFSKEKATNFNWDFNRNLSTPISSLARIVLFSVPIGMTNYNRTLGTPEFNEKKLFFSIIMSQQNFQENLSKNDDYLRRRELDKSDSEAIIGFLTAEKHKSENIHKNSYSFIELHSDIGAKKTLLEYQHIPSYIVEFLSEYGEQLHKIKHYMLKDKFVRSILKGIDPKGVIYELMRIAVKPKLERSSEVSILKESKRLAIFVAHATLARRRIINAKNFEEYFEKYNNTKEDHMSKDDAEPQKKNVKTRVEYMKKDDSKLWVIYNYGLNLQYRLTSGQQNEDKDTNSLSGRKKLESIAYRLINNIKSGDKTGFMDTLFRLYLSASRSSNIKIDSQNKKGIDDSINEKVNNKNNYAIPSIFLEGFQSEGIGMDFDTIATAFVAGLLGEKFKGDN